MPQDIGKHVASGWFGHCYIWFGGSGCSGRYLFLGLLRSGVLLLWVIAIYLLLLLCWCGFDLFSGWCRCLLLIHCWSFFLFLYNETISLSCDYLFDSLGSGFLLLIGLLFIHLSSSLAKWTCGHCFDSEVPIVVPIIIIKYKWYLPGLSELELKIFDFFGYHALLLHEILAFFEDIRYGSVCLGYCTHI